MLLLISLLACIPEPIDHEPVRFIAIGDTGEGNTAQHEVAAVMETVCANQGCDFVLLLGDNIYDVGVDGTMDAQWDEKFELPYANVDLPFYAVLGNHDYANFNNYDVAGHQVAYTAVSDKWNMPDRWYSFVRQNVGFYGLDTEGILLSPDAMEPDLLAPQQAWIDQQLDPDRDDLPAWRIAYGHHPYLSNGRHGNAGIYDSLPEGTLLAGVNVKSFVEDKLCGRVDLYLSGHDHDRQWHETRCEGTRFIVSGAGAKLRDFDEAQPTVYADDQTEGFFWFEIDDDTLRAQAWDRAGQMNHEGGWTRMGVDER